MVYGRYGYSIHGVYKINKHNWAPSCGIIWWKIRGSMASFSGDCGDGTTMMVRRKTSRQSSEMSEM
jgi:hypothetical protein